jgi:hypothetical protein
VRTRTGARGTGGGATTDFTLHDNPGNLNNLDVSIGGVSQRPGVDYHWSGGTTLSFVSAPSAGSDNILVRYMQGLPQSGSALPNLTGQQTRFLTNDGANASWADMTTDVVGYTPEGTGAVFLKVTSDLNAGIAHALRFISTAEHAAIRNLTSVYDARVALQTMHDALPGYGGQMRLPRGLFNLSDTAGHCLKFTKPIVLEGDGRYTVLTPLGSVSDASDTILVQPDPIYDVSGFEFRRFFLGTTATGQRKGLNGIMLDTQASGANLPGLIIERVEVGQGSGAGGCSIKHVNDGVVNVNGGLYGAHIRNCRLRGGIYLFDCGDSLSIEKNIITDIGSGATTGVFVSAVDGASQVDIVGNNITTALGQVKINAGNRVNIRGNNCEQRVAGGSSAAMINIAGENGTVTQCWIEKNNLGAGGGLGTGIAYNIRLNNCDGVVVQHNQLLPASNTCYGVTVYVGTNNVYIGPNQWGTDSNLRVQDNGSTDLMGVWRSFASFSNHWIAFGSAGFAAPAYRKDGDGRVTIKGIVKFDGTVPTGWVAQPGVATSVICNLPSAYRPIESEYFQTACQDATPHAGVGELLVSAGSGNLIWESGYYELFAISCSFMASAGADFISNE